MADWAAFVWVAVGVLVSSVLPFAVTALWPAQTSMLHVSSRLTAREIFERIWPGVRMVLAALVVGGVVLAGARAAGVVVATWWEALLIGLAADRSVQVVHQLVRRRFTL
jgi:heme exporter protein D